jgi:type IV secretory pathway VirB6-like protein
MEATTHNTRFQKARNYKRKWVTIKAEIKSSLYIMLGIIAAGFGLNGFLLVYPFYSLSLHSFPYLY